MSISQIQKLLNERNLDLQQISEKTGLDIDSIQNFEPQVQKTFDELKKISDVLNIPPQEVLEISLENSFPDGGPSEAFCALFPDSPRCKQSVK